MQYGELFDETSIETSEICDNLTLGQDKIKKLKTFYTKNSNKQFNESIN